MGLNRQGARSIVAAVFTLSLAIPAAAQTASAIAQKSTANLSRIRIDNFGQINANYYRGAQPKGQDYADLAAIGVKSVIDLTDDDTDSTEPSMVKRSGMKAFHIPMNTHITPSKEQVVQFFKIVNDPANQPVYVHCAGGRHRTGVMTAVYRMTFDGWTADQAYREMKRYKFGPAFLHPEFKAFVYGFRPSAKTVLVHTSADVAEMA
jgi:protein tyrosine/serine phosphatase